MEFKKSVPSMLVNKFNALGVDSVESLLSNFEKMTQRKYFGGISKAELVKFMDSEGIPVPQKFSAPVSVSYCPNDFVSRQIAEIVGFGYVEFIYQVSGRLNLSFQKLGICDLPSLHAKIDKLQAELASKKQTQVEFFSWVSDVVAFCRDTSAPVHGVDYCEKVVEYLNAFGEMLDESYKYIFKNLILDDEKSYEDVASYLDVKRQCVDQKIQSLRKAVANYLLGCTVEGLPKVDLVLAKMIYRLTCAIDQRNFMSCGDLSRFLGNGCPQNNTRVLRILGNIYGYKVVTVREDETSFCFKKTIQQSVIKTLVSSIEDVLKQSIVPINGDDVVIAVKKDLGRVADKGLILYILDHYSCIEKVGCQYQIKMRYLGTAANMAVRILHNAQRAMSIQEIAKEINRICLAEGGKLRENIHGANFAQNKNLLPKGKSGYWTLKSFATRVETLSIKQQIVHILQAHSLPMTISDIKRELKSLNCYAPNTLYITLLGADFARLKDKRIILSSWKDLYKSDLKLKCVRKKKNRVADTVNAQICNTVKQMFADQGVSCMELADVRKALKKRGFNDVTVYSAIGSDASIKKERVGRCVRLHY